MVSMKKNKQVSGQPITIGLDVGYGAVKAVSDGKSAVFPSVWARAIEQRFQTSITAEKYPGDDISDDEGDWWIGNKAMKHAPGDRKQNARGRTASETSIGHVARVRLAKAAISKLYPMRTNGDVVHIRLATGLPVSHMPGAAELKAAFIGQHLIQTDIADFVANITECAVMPQPYGTIYANMIMPTGKLNPCHTYTRTGVVDVGTFTIDIALDDDAEYLDEMSASSEASVSRIHTLISAEYERRFSQKIDQEDIETITRNGCIRVKGKLENFTDVVAQGRAELTEATLNLMGRTWGAATRVDVIYVAGGGAGFVFDELKRAYPQAQLVENAQLSNAQGYYNFAQFKATGD